ncbi:MAG: SDR family oxidoreductase [Solirubrobacterales bacterium]|nr:SDR family oxidoreductase [Solirubrobacterales bacterium]MBV9942102.1 SDR family oxidoreductase [Solirubrobacterales bacterium]
MRVDVDAPLDAEWMRGRTALVTGGGGREGGPGTIGWAISRLLARHGAAVAVLDRDPAAAERTVAQVRRGGGAAVPVVADLTDDAECHSAVQEACDALGGLDTLVNNVAAWNAAELFDVDPTQFDELLTLNLKTAWQMTRHAIAVMPAGGAVVNITSVAARRAGTVYGLAKSGLESLTGGAAYLLGERGIRINAVELGALWTAAVADNLPTEAREPRRKMNALGTEGDCWDAAAAVLFLASDQARWISGQVLAVDGGGPARMPYPGVTRSPAQTKDHSGTDALAQTEDRPGTDAPAQTGAPS